jgi:hypothetical protein
LTTIFHKFGWSRDRVTTYDHVIRFYIYVFLLGSLSFLSIKYHSITVYSHQLPVLYYDPIKLPFHYQNLFHQLRLLSQTINPSRACHTPWMRMHFFLVIIFYLWTIIRLPYTSIKHQLPNLRVRDKLII